MRKITLLVTIAVLCCGTAAANELHEAARKGDLLLVKSILAKGMPIDAVDDQGLTPLHHAASAGKLEVVQLLSLRGAKINARAKSGVAPLYMAVTGSHVAVVRYLLSGGADPKLTDQRGGTALHVSSQKGGALQVQIATLLLANGALINAKSTGDLTQYT